MGRKLTPFSLIQHKDAGSRLWAIDDYLSKLAVDVGNAYGAREMDKAIKARRVLDLLRSNLDSEMSKEYPTLEHPNQIYYHVDQRTG